MKRPCAALMSAVGVAAASASLGSPALLAVAIGLVLLTGGAWAAVAVSAYALKVERRIGASEVQEDRPLRLCFRIRGRRWLPVRLEVQDHSGGWLAVGAGGASLEIHVGRPGAYRLAPTEVRVRDAIGMFELRRLAGRMEPLLILPAPTGHSSVKLPRSEVVEDPEPHGLRPYTPGMPLTRIHWPALARGAGLQVRHFAPASAGLPLVVVDTVGAAGPGALDWAARLAAGYVLALARNGGCRVLLPGDASATSVIGVGGEWRAVHRRLARLGDLPPGIASPPAARTAALSVYAAAAPGTLTPAPPLPDGVLAAARWSPARG
jgi:uncharacterized protein (DUF58 family)